MDLRDRQRDKVGGYSFGMRQRLGVAAALLRDPRLLVPDEPANGPDPAGIRDMRALIKRLAASGLTVLLSSHDMVEVGSITGLDLTRKVLLTTPFESWHGLFAQHPFTGPLNTGLAVSVAWTLICLTGAYLSLRRRDITGG